MLVALSRRLLSMLLDTGCVGKGKRRKADGTMPAVVDLKLELRLEKRGGFMSQAMPAWRSILFLIPTFHAENRASGLTRARLGLNGSSTCTFPYGGRREIAVFVARLGGDNEKDQGADDLRRHADNGNSNATGTHAVDPGKLRRAASIGANGLRNGYDWSDCDRSIDAA